MGECALSISGRDRRHTTTKHLSFVFRIRMRIVMYCIWYYFFLFIDRYIGDDTKPIGHSSTALHISYSVYKEVHRRTGTGNVGLSISNPCSSNHHDWGSTVQPTGRARSGVVARLSFLNCCNGTPRGPGSSSQSPHDEKESLRIVPFEAVRSPRAARNCGDDQWNRSIPGDVERLV